MLEISMENSQKLEVNLPRNPVLGLLGMCSKDLTSYYGETCWVMLIVSPFTIARKWKQSKYFPMLNGQWKCGHYTQFYSPAKKNEIVKCVDEWMELENSTPSWGNPDPERQMSRVLTYRWIWALKLQIWICILWIYIWTQKPWREERRMGKEL